MPMSPKMFRLAAVWGALLAAAPGPVMAQYCPSCAASAPPPIAMASNACCAPVTCNVCEQLQPVVQPCYRTVPVTEYRPTKVTVQKPINETEWIDRQVTEYRPICETKTAEVPTVSWQTVTECQTVQRDMGYWTTHYECRQQCSPCQYDPRPGIAGWWNRTAYSIRSSMQPKVIARRQYVPNVVTQQVPIARQVPQYGTRQVSYQVTRMEPYTPTRKVAVNKVRWVAEEVTQMQPVTVMKTIPTGSTIAWVSPSQMGNGTATALAPTPDYNRPRSANRDYDDRHERDGYRRADDNFGKEPGRGASLEPFSKDGEAPAPVPAKKISNPVVKPAYDERQYPEARTPTPVAPVETSEIPLTTVPTVVRANRWARSRATEPTPVTSISTNPKEGAVTVTVARTAR